MHNSRTVFAKHKEKQIAIQHEVQSVRKRESDPISDDGHEDDKDTDAELHLNGTNSKVSNQRGRETERGSNPNNSSNGGYNDPHDPGDHHDS